MDRPPVSEGATRVTLMEPRLTPGTAATAVGGFDPVAAVVMMKGSCRKMQQRIACHRMCYRNSCRLLLYAIGPTIECAHMYRLL